MTERHYILKAASVSQLMQQEQSLLMSNPGFGVAFKRYFLSDRSQRLLLPDQSGAISYIVQPPLDGSAAGVWLYLVADATVTKGPGWTDIEDNGVIHHFQTNLCSSAEGSEAQTTEILQKYGNSLQKRNLTLAGNCARTWFYVDDIDNNYAGMVKARRELFTDFGLTPDTHYIASTGICGAPVPSESLVQMDAYAIEGPFSQRYLYAPTHLNPTYEYGVTFERGVRIDCPCNRDRCGEKESLSQGQILISGTASINNKGEVLHVGDVVAQTHRMWENVEVLLSEGGASWTDVRQILVYLRYAEDYGKVAPMFAAKFPDTPYIILHAPVCRPTWLIEMECIATTAN